MLRMALLFLVVALIAAFLGLTGVAAVSLDAARILFFVAIVLAIVFFVGNLLRGASPRDVV